MANQHDKVQLFIAEDSIEDESLLIKKLSIATIDSIKDILPKEILEIEFRVVDENKRVLILTPYGKKYEELCEAVL